MRRSRRELSNEYLLGNVGFDTAENELSKVSPIDPPPRRRMVRPRKPPRTVVARLVAELLNAMHALDVPGVNKADGPPFFEVAETGRLRPSAAAN